MYSGVQGGSQHRGPASERVCAFVCVCDVCVWCVCALNLAACRVPRRDTTLLHGTPFEALRFGCSSSMHEDAACLPSAVHAARSNVPNLTVCRVPRMDTTLLHGLHGTSSRASYEGESDTDGDGLLVDSMSPRRGPLISTGGRAVRFHSSTQQILNASAAASASGSSSGALASPGKNDRIDKKGPQQGRAAGGSVWLLLYRDRLKVRGARVFSWLCFAIACSVKCAVACTRCCVRLCSHSLQLSKPL